VVTIVAILSTDLLKGIGIGMLVAYFVIIRENYKNSFKFLSKDHDPGSAIRMELSNMVTFINKGVLVDAFNKLPDNAHLIIDGSNTQHFDYDVLELIHEFKNHKASQRHIKVDLIGIPDLPVGGLAH
jgi:carbonic anhydrase